MEEVSVPIAERKVIVVMPAYNASQTLKLRSPVSLTIGSTGLSWWTTGSKDETVRIATELGLSVFLHTHNFGYGANQKTCYQEALKAGATIIVMVHPDYQYDPTLLPELIRPIEDGQCDVVFGSRMKGISAYRQGMPWWKYVSNIALTWLENRVFGLHLSEFHTGYRAYRREVLEQVSFLANSDGFIFDQQIVAQFASGGFRIGEISVPVRYFPEASERGSDRQCSLWTGNPVVVCSVFSAQAGPLASMQYTVHASRYRPVK